MENGETTLQGALRECMEEANAEIDNPRLSGIFDIPHINQVYVFYSGTMSKPSFGPGIESLEVELFREQDIPWQELAFPVVELALHYHFKDLPHTNAEAPNQTGVRTGTIERPWRSPRQ